MLSRLYRLLRRETSGGRFVPEIDGLRFVALSLVLLYHVQMFMPHRQPVVDMFGAVANKGNIGVQLFFVLSGYILGVPFARAALGTGSTVSLRRYFTRRLTRLEPPYLVHYLILFPWFLYTYGGTVTSAIGSLLAGLTYTHTLIYGAYNPINNPTWSLEIEAQFYLAVPILALLFRIGPPRLRRSILGAAIVGCCLVGFLPIASAFRFVHSLPGQLQYFLSGLLLADLQVARPADAEPHALWDVAGLAAVVALFILITTFARGAILAAPLLGIFVVATLRGRALRTLLSHPALTSIGGMCYTVYLYHQAIMLMVLRDWPLPLPTWLGPGAQFAAYCVVWLPIVLLCSTALYLLVEKPFMAARPTLPFLPGRGH